jgi:hypothetical protein
VKTVPLVLIACAAACLPAGAQAATLKGSVPHKLRVKITTTADGSAKRLFFSWNARCGSQGTRFHAFTAIRPERPTPTFHSHGRYKVKAGHGLRGNVRGRARGKRRSLELWTGHFSASVVLKRHGRTVDRCRLPEVSWRATPAS